MTDIRLYTYGPSLYGLGEILSVTPRPARDPEETAMTDFSVVVQGNVITTLPNGVRILLSGVYGNTEVRGRQTASGPVIEVVSYMSSGGLACSCRAWSGEDPPLGHDPGCPIHDGEETWPWVG